MSVQLVIAEKPSVARSIAAVIGATEKQNGYWQGSGYLVSWCIGHLVSFAEAGQYDEKYCKWRYEDLPILPQPWQFIVPDEKKPQFEVLRALLNRPDVDSVTAATDAGREGELIFRFVYQMAGCKKPFQRLWISSMEDAAIREGFANLRPGADYDELRDAALCRAKADWLVGINATRLFSVLYHRTLNIGRVMSPTLALIVQREAEIDTFKPIPFYTVALELPGLTVSGERISDRASAEQLKEACQDAAVTIKKVECKEKSEKPPALYDLTTLQRDANRQLGYTAQQTLDYLQSLYEKKVMSYPRTGSRYIPEDVFDEMPERVALLGQYPRFAGYAAGLDGAALNRRSVNDSKVTDHHALIITENLPGELSKDERAVYELVAGRMLEAFSGKCVKDVTTALLSGGDTDFTVKGSVMKEAGWRAVFGEQETGGDEEAASLPPLQEGEYLPLSGVDLLEKQTKPKPLHTESSLLAAMENAGKELEDAELKASLKDAGIGTPATRAAIIETLFARQYIVREKKNLVPTDKGLAVYRIVRDKKIADVEMTGMWETALAKIEAGSMDADMFRKGIEVYAAQITAELLSVQLSIANGETCSCPKCNNGRILFYPKVAKCSNVDCTLTIFRNKCDKQLSDKQIVELATKRKTGLIKGFKGKNGKAFDASLVLDEQFNIGFSFPEKKAKPKK